MKSNTQTTGAKTPVNILLVDDREENLKALSAILEHPDYRLVTARSGEEALKCLLQDDFAAVLLDVRMPGMDGLELGKRIRSRERNILTPLLFMTATSRATDEIVEGYSVGAVDYMIKPLHPEVVRAKVKVLADLHRVSAELRLQSDQFQKLAESIPQIVFTVLPDGKTSYLNERWTEYSGLSPEQSEGEGWLTVVHPDDQKGSHEKYQSAISSGLPFEIELRFKRARDGVYNWHLSRALPIRDSQNKVIEWFGTTTDIESQKQAELQLKETLKARDEYFSIASHELKNPLTALYLGLQLVEKKLRDESNKLIPVKSIQDLLAVSVSQCRKLVDLIENLLDVARIRSGRLSVEHERVDFKHLVQDTVERLQSLAVDAGCALTVNLSESVAEAPIECEIDRMRMEQVVTNLIVNATKYGKGQPIEVTLTSDAESATLTVRDHGMGILKEDQTRIFGRFERVVAHKDFAGLGLGLYITQEIVRAHGGEISVESESGQGAAFSVRILKHAHAVMKLAG